MSFESLQIGASALTAASTSMLVSGHNVSNASTEGYSRQIASASAGTAVENNNNLVGNGVSISSISRVVDEYYLKTLREANNNSGYSSYMEQGYSSIETFLGGVSTNDLTTAMDSFWAALNDLSTDSTDTSLRQQVVTQASDLCETINAISENLTSLQQEINTDVVQTVDDLNEITARIAELNVEILKDEAGGSSNCEANDLRDERESLMNELSYMIDINVVVDSDGSYNIYNNNFALVYRDQSYEVGLEKTIVDENVFYTPVLADGKKELDLNGGKLGAQLELRDETIVSYSQELDELASSLIWEINRQYSQGTGLEGYAEITSDIEVVNPSATLDELNYGFTPVEGTYEIEDGSFELIVYDTETGEEKALTIDVTLTGSADDTILYDSANPTADNSLVNMMQDKLDSYASGAFSVSLNENNQLEITSNTEMYQLGFGEDTTGVVAALGLNTMFSGHDASDISVSDALEGNTALLATSKSIDDVTTNNLTEIIALADEPVMSNGSETFASFFLNTVVRVGNESALAQSDSEYQSDILAMVENECESVSGVSIDEEMTNLIACQTAYNAASKFISTINECYERLIDM